MAEHSDPEGVAAPTLEALRAFVEDMARFGVGDDDLADSDFRDAFAPEHDLDPKAITEEDFIGGLDAERLHDETALFWTMIKRARTLLGEGGAVDPG